jgi:hypothetical protein
MKQTKCMNFELSCLQNFRKRAKDFPYCLTDYGILMGFCPLSKLCSFYVGFLHNCLIAFPAIAPIKTIASVFLFHLEPIGVVHKL